MLRAWTFLVAVVATFAPCISVNRLPKISDDTTCVTPEALCLGQ